MSIDIKVFQTFSPRARAAPSCKSCFRQLNAGEGQALALRLAPKTRLQVLTDLAFILQILHILAILLQTDDTATACPSPHENGAQP